uniref:Large ribosomal subunit protein uL23m n=1 Tax=Canis lupus familiaris TaxID=9615 RepID=A0A8C0Z6G3_CANLF
MARNVLYPLYQLGNPQLRIFRTNFFIQLVRPGTAQPEDTVQFRIPMEMTRVDLRNYLERIYNVPVAAVRTRVQHGSNRKRDYRNVRVKKPDYKVAYVQLAHGQTFTFPDLFPEKKSPDGSPGDGPSPNKVLRVEQGHRLRVLCPTCPCAGLCPMAHGTHGTWPQARSRACGDCNHVTHFWPREPTAKVLVGKVVSDRL